MSITKALKTTLPNLTDAQIDLVELNAKYQNEKACVDNVAQAKLSACEGKIYQAFITNYNSTVGAELDRGIEIIKNFADTIGLSEQELENATNIALKNM